MRVGLRTAAAPLVLGSIFLFASIPSTAAPITLKLQAGGVTTVPAASSGGDSLTSLEIDAATMAGDGDSGDGENDLGDRNFVINRGLSRGHHAGSRTTGSGKRAKSNPELVKSFNGLSFFDQRFANGGNQFSVEPPDQGLCAGNGFVMESVNDVLSIYDTSGHLLRGPVDLNTFYGYAAAINRANGRNGPKVTDPSCYYDADTQRWFQVVLTLDRAGTTSSLAGPNHLDIAVSQTADPTGAWNLYMLPVQNDGTHGTPNHGCALRYCLGDYPHIGADANAFFVTTNEFSLFGSGFYGAQIYAISKRALASG